MGILLVVLCSALVVSADVVQPQRAEKSSRYRRVIVGGGGSGRGESIKSRKHVTKTTMRSVTKIESTLELERRKREEQAQRCIDLIRTHLPDRNLDRESIHSEPTAAVAEMEPWHNTSIYVIKGGHLTIKCPGGDFEKTVLWQKDGVPVRMAIMSDPVQRIFLREDGAIRFHPAEYKDAGLYICSIDDQVMGTVYLVVTSSRFPIDMEVLGSFMSVALCLLLSTCWTVMATVGFVIRIATDENFRKQNKLLSKRDKSEQEQQRVHGKV